jgi:phosphate transport system substrate-binding protein
MKMRLLSGIALATSLLTASAQRLTGAGSTFAYPLYSSWAGNFQKSHPNVEINYQSIGSGGGIRQLSAGTVDFGGTDGPMTDTQLQDARNHLGTDILHFPTALGADVPTYNVPEVSAELNFTPEVLAGIFLGKITKWNDPALQTANPDVKLPASGIVVVHRSEASGTTYVWVDYLSKISLEWKNKIGVGFSVAWPVGLGGKGNADGQNLTAPLSYSRVPPSVIAKEMQTIQQLQY